MNHCLVRVAGSWRLRRIHLSDSRLCPCNRRYSHPTRADNIGTMKGIPVHRLSSYDGTGTLETNLNSSTRFLGRQSGRLPPSCNLPVLKELLRRTRSRLRRCSRSKPRARDDTSRRFRSEDTRKYPDTDPPILHWDTRREWHCKSHHISLTVHIRRYCPLNHRFPRLRILQSLPLHLQDHRWCQHFPPRLHQHWSSHLPRRYRTHNSRSSRLPDKPVRLSLHQNNRSSSAVLACTWSHRRHRFPIAPHRSPVRRRHHRSGSNPTAAPSLLASTQSSPLASSGGLHALA